MGFPMQLQKCWVNEINFYFITVSIYVAVMNE